MKNLLLATTLCAVALSGCASLQTISSSTSGSKLAAVASKIDAGAQLAAAELPTACLIVGQIATLAGAYSSSALARGGSAATISMTADVAGALADSPLCQNPDMANPIAASIQIIGAAAAIKAATAGFVSAPRAAASVQTGAD
jgi:uncharacterized protein YceK